jgi:hypothetical protein
LEIRSLAEQEFLFFFFTFFFRRETSMSTLRMRRRAKIALRQLLILIALIAMIVTGIGVLVPPTQRISDENMSRTTIYNNLSQCAKAVHLAHDNNKKYPPYYGPYAALNAASPASFHTHLLPFVDQAPLYNQFVNEPGSLTTAAVPPYLSSLDPTQDNNGAGACNFAVNLRLYYDKGGLGTLTSGTALIYPRMPRTFTDGTSNTLLFATKYMHCGGTGGSMWCDPGKNAIDSPMAATFGASMKLWQLAPSKAACDPTAGTAVSFTPQRIVVAMCDTSLRTPSVGLSQATWQALHTPGAGDPIGRDWDD